MDNNGLQSSACNWIFVKDCRKCSGFGQLMKIIKLIIRNKNLMLQLVVKVNSIKGESLGKIPTGGNSTIYISSKLRVNSLDDFF